MPDWCRRSNHSGTHTVVWGTCTCTAASAGATGQILLLLLGTVGEQALAVMEARLGHHQAARAAFEAGARAAPPHAPLLSAWARMEVRRSLTASWLPARRPLSRSNLHREQCFMKKRFWCIVRETPLLHRSHAACSHSQTYLTPA